MQEANLARGGAFAGNEILGDGAIEVLAPTDAGLFEPGSRIPSRRMRRLAVLHDDQALNSPQHR